MFNIFDKATATLAGKVTVMTAMPSAQPLLLPAPRSPADQLKDFEEGLAKLEAAIKRNKSAREQLSRFQEMGTWDSLWGGLTGQNDKDMAKMLTEFGASLETTQSVVQLLTQLHTVNNNVLRSFNDALVRKIELLQTDSQTLEGNQNGSLVVLCEFKRQIDDLLQLYDGYERCNRELTHLQWTQANHVSEMADMRIRHDNLLTSNSHRIEALSHSFTTDSQSRTQQNAEFKTILTRHSDTLAVQTRKIEALDAALITADKTIERLSLQVTASLGELNKSDTLQNERLKVLEAQLRTLLENQRQSEARMSLIEQNTSAKPKWIDHLRQQAIALAALMFAAAALAVNIPI